jgi:hypothetical protein
MTPILANSTGPPRFRDQKQRLHRGLPFFGIVFCLRQFSDVERSVTSGLRSGNTIGSSNR